MKKQMPFTLKMQTILVVLLLVSFVLMGQGGALILFEIGAVLLIATIILNMAFSNMSSDLTFKQSIWPFWWRIFIVIAVFGGSILLAPLFLDKGFVKNFVLAIIFGTIGIFVLFIIIGTPKPKKGGA